MPHILNFELFSKFDAMFNGKQITGNKVGPYPGDRIVVEGREGTTLERGPCILVRILDNPVCFSGCLSTTHVQRFSLLYAPSSEGVELEEGRNLRSAVSPPRTRCHQAQLGMSLGHQHVYQAFFPDESVPRWATPSPSAPFSYRIISFLNFVSFPYERLSLSLSLSLSFHVAVRLLPLYAFDAIILGPLWRLVNSANPLEGRCITAEGFEIEKYIIYITFLFLGNGEIAFDSFSKRNGESFRAQRDIYLEWLMVKRKGWTLGWPKIKVMAVSSFVANSSGNLKILDGLS